MMYYNKHNWVNTTALLAISLEQFLTESLFKSDLTRVVYATADYAYRRRFELMDSSREFEKVNASSLQFPFASYHIDNNWSPIPEKRIYPLEELGVNAASQQGNLRLIQVENKVNILLHYDREDDARFALDQISFMSSSKRWKTQEATYNFDSLDIPFSFSIDPSKISFEPKVQETDWLKQNRLFILSFDVDVQSMLLFPPAQYLDDSGFNPVPFSISETVTMEFTSGKGTSITTVMEAIDDSSIVLDSFILERVTKTTAKLSWSFEDQDNFNSIRLEVNGKSYDLENSDYMQTVRGLISGADYLADLYITKGNYSKHFSLKFTTTADAKSEVDLVGTTW